jgi:phage-related protein
MPFVRKLEPGLWEVRSVLPDGIGRVLFTVIEHDMILLHAFKKKSRKTPAHDLSLALSRLKQLQ